MNTTQIVIPLRQVLAPVLDSTTAPANPDGLFAGVGSADLGDCLDDVSDNKYAEILNVAVSGLLATAYPNGGLSGVLDPTSPIVAVVRCVSISVWYRVIVPAGAHVDASMQAWVE